MDQSDKGPVEVEQTVVERWQNGKIQNIGSMETLIPPDQQLTGFVFAKAKVDSADE